MPAHREITESPHSVPQLYALVAEVEKYPEFLPWCRAARIIKRIGEQEFLAELVISFKHLTESYTSRVTLTPPTETGERAEINAEMVSGPFEYLKNHWVFTALPGGKTQIDFFVDFRFRSKLLETLIGGLFAKATNKMAAAFAERADALYGKR